MSQNRRRPDEKPVPIAMSAWSLLFDAALPGLTDPGPHACDRFVKSHAARDPAPRHRRIAVHKGEGSRLKPTLRRLRQWLKWLFRS